MASIETLFRPLRINGVTLRNRLAMGPIAAHSPFPGGRASEQTAAFFAARARGGIGLIIVGGTVSTTHGWESHMPNRNVLRLDKDEFVPDLMRVTDAVHAYDTPIFAQINTGQGRMGKPGPLHIAASAVSVVVPQEHLPNGIVLPGGLALPSPRAATLEEIEQLEIDTAASAIRMQNAGFDGVELGAHMSYFLASFLSPRTNLRDDHYGGNVENRVRIVANIIRRIRAGTRSAFPIGIRMSVNEHVPGGADAVQSAEIARLLELAGANYIAMTDGVYETMAFSMPRKDGVIAASGDAKTLRTAVSIPLLMQGVHDPHNAAHIVSDGHADAVMLARQMLADPEYANKVREGRIDSIVRCNRDNVCLRRLMMNMPVLCPLNPLMGHESIGPGLRPPFARRVSALTGRLILKVTKSPSVMKALMRLAGPSGK